MKLAKQTIAVIYHLADEWQVIISRAKKQAGILQDAQDRKNLLKDNIEDLSDKAKTKYLLNLGNEIKITTDKKAR